MEPVDIALVGPTGRFVIHRHAAATLHYDLRVEVAGRLRSWSLPKGPPEDVADERVAVDVGRNPLSLLDFEGPLPDPDGHTGTVIVWDRGTFRNLTIDEQGCEVAMPRAIDHGSVTVWLHGQRITGQYALRRLEAPDLWRLTRFDDGTLRGRPRPAADLTSVLSGRTNADLARTLRTIP